MVVCGALVVGPASDIYTPQDLANRVMALDYGNGTAYAGLLMLEGAMPRESITTRAAPVNPGERFASLMRGEIDATVLQEPWITAAEKAGCRLVSTTYFYGTWVADCTVVNADAYAAFVRATTRAVRRINADKRRYLPYFIRAYPGCPEVPSLQPEDFNLGRIQLKEPGPIPEDQAAWAWEWMASWGLLHGAFDPAAQINTPIAQEAHEVAATSLRE